jgi:hypothetical protein
MVPGQPPPKDRHSKVGKRHGEFVKESFLMKAARYVYLRFKTIQAIGPERCYQKFPHLRPRAPKSFSVGKLIGQVRNENGHWENVYDLPDE